MSAEYATRPTALQELDELPPVLSSARQHVEAMAAAAVLAKAWMVDFAKSCGLGRVAEMA